MHRRIVILALAYCLGCNSLCASDLDRLVARLEAEVPGLMDEAEVPGLSMVLIRDNRIAWQGCFGVRVAGEPAEVDADTVFEAASMSKPLFSYAVLKLVERGEFDLDRPLDGYLPEPYLPEQPLAGKITGRMVMLHRTGLPNWREGGWRSGGPLTVTKEPGSCFTYSGEGYLYLQTAVERLTEQPMATWMEEALLAPLKMTRSSYEWQETLEANFAGGHDKQGTFKTGRRFYQQGNAAYSLYTTPADYARFLIEIMKQDRAAAHSLGAELIEQMTTLQVEPEGDDIRSGRSLGWVVEPAEKGGWVSHSGSNGSGFRCNARFHPERRSGSVIMTNSSNGQKVWEAILEILDELDPGNAAGTDERNVGGQPRYTTWRPEDRTIRYEYRLMNPTREPATGVDVYVPLPLESPRQEIRYLHLPEGPACRVITDRHGQRLAHYALERIEPGARVDLGYVAGITLKNMRWNAAAPSPAEGPAELPAELRELYLRPEANYSMESSLMRRTAASLAEGAATDFEKLVRIHDYVTDSVRYVRDGKWDPAATVLARGTGSCSEYNYVVSGLCRLAGLPTRCVGGSTNGFRELPTTDTVYHRWTEVFLSGYGWFPVDCSRDANPIRGKRSHFGRVYVDAVVWCRQAGGEDDSLGWDYRAKSHVRGKDPGIRESHRTRWFVAYPESEMQTAYAWFLDGTGELPQPDLLECALLRWDQAADEQRLRMIEALADAGRNVCLRRAAMLSEAGGIREAAVRKLCDSADLADVVVERSRDLWRFRNWFKSNESHLVSAGEGRFTRTRASGGAETPVTTACSSQIWMDLVPEVVSRVGDSLQMGDGTAVAVMPVVDQTPAGLGERRGAIVTALKQHFSSELGVELVDEARFARWMEEQGPGRGEYWILVHGENGRPPAGLEPDFIVVPVCITSSEEDAAIYRLELKTLELGSGRYTQAVAQAPIVTAANNHGGDYGPASVAEIGGVRACGARGGRGNQSGVEPPHSKGAAALQKGAAALQRGAAALQTRPDRDRGGVRFPAPSC